MKNNKKPHYFKVIFGTDTIYRWRVTWSKAMSNVSPKAVAATTTTRGRNAKGSPTAPPVLACPVLTIYVVITRRTVLTQSSLARRVTHSELWSAVELVPQHSQAPRNELEIRQAVEPGVVSIQQERREQRRHVQQRPVQDDERRPRVAADDTVPRVPSPCAATTATATAAAPDVSRRTAWERRRGLDLSQPRNRKVCPSQEGLQPFRGILV